jgi:hypothetical protein
MKSFQTVVLTDYVKRARTTGTLADAAIAADYLMKVSGAPYAACMNALRAKYGIRYAERECKDRPSIFVEKNPKNDPIPVRFDRTIISETKVPDNSVALIAASI